MRCITQNEIKTAVNKTKADLIALVNVIGQDQFFEIFDNYSPTEDDDPPSALIASLFENTLFTDKFEQLFLAEDYIMGVWKRCTTRLNIIIDGSQKKQKQGLQSKWLRVKRAAFERDGYKCQLCGSQKDLCGHHVKERAQYPELAYDVSNIVTLCKYCHAKQHPGKEKLITRKRRRNERA